MKKQSSYMLNLLSDFLRNQNVDYSEKVLKVQLEIENENASFFTRVSKILNEYDLSCNTYYSDFETLQNEIQYGILHFKMSGGRYVVLQNINLIGNVFFYDPVIDRNIEICQSAFLKLWSGIVLSTGNKIRKSNKYPQLNNRKSVRIKSREVKNSH